MRCKFLVFLLIVFFFFLFFSSACEFRFIERIGTHGKQNPDFVIIIFAACCLISFCQLQLTISRHIFYVLFFFFNSFP